MRPRKIKLDRWYLLDLRNIDIPKLMRIDFRDKATVKAFIRNEKNGSLDWEYISGKDAINLKLKFKGKTKSSDDMAYVVIYDYPPEAITMQERKNYRTDFRRLLRNGKK